MRLEEILRAPEGKDPEFERDLSSPKGVVRTLVAFANAAGDRLVVGIEDGARTVVGVPDPLAREERIAHLVADAVEPRLLPEIEMVPWRTTHVVVVTVHPSASRPHHAVADGPERGTYVRLGPTNRVADAPRIAELARRMGAEGFDGEPLADLDSEAIDFGAASQWFAELRQLRRSDLEALGLVRSFQGRTVPTVGGLPLFGATDSGASRTRTCRWAASPVRSASNSSTAPTGPRTPWRRSPRRSRSWSETRVWACRSVGFAGSTCRPCRPRRCARPWSTRSPTTTTPRPVHRSAWRCSTNASRSRTRVSCSQV